jgi:hypothetical protein
MQPTQRSHRRHGMQHVTHGADPYNQHPHAITASRKM